MRENECSAMGCDAETAEDRDLVCVIRTRTKSGHPVADGGVNFAFCRTHGEHFLREWAGLRLTTDASDKNFYVIAALTEEQHRSLVMRGMSGMLDDAFGGSK